MYFSDIIQSEAISTNFCRGGAYELMNTNTPDPNGYCPKDIVYFFFYPASLIPRGIENAPSEKCELYIKLTWPEEQNNFLLIISFHD